MLARRFFRKTAGFSALEVLLVIVIFVILCGSAYVLEYTDITDSFFNNNKHNQLKENILPKLVNIPLVTHNQIIMSLTGAPLETSKADGSLLFPFSSDMKIATEWPVNAGFLVKSNVDGHFDLLGYRYLKTNKQFAKDGYDALLNLDTNSDGILDDLDVDYNKLYFWQDTNSDGIINQNEVKKLIDLGIIAINMSSMQQVNMKINNSTVTKRMTYKRNDGTEGVLFDVDLFQNPYYREYLIKLPLDDEIKKLPNVTGSGAVRDLQDAMTLNPDLLSLFMDYLAVGAADRRFIRMDKILFEWAKTSDYLTFKTRLQSNFTPHFDLALGNTLTIKNYEDGVSPQQDLIRKIMIIENFTSKKLLYFFAQEILNGSTQQWKLHLTISLGQQVISSQVINANQDGSKRKVLLGVDELQFTPAQASTIYSQYNQLKIDLFNRIQSDVNNVQFSNQSIKNQQQWLDLKLKKQIDMGQIYQKKYSKPAVDLPRRRALSECVKPNNIIDRQVIDCAAGKISKTWK